MPTTDRRFRRLAVTDAIRTKDITASGTISVPTMVVTESLQFGDASVDTMILKGRMSSMTAGGANIDIGSTYTYSEGVELRYSVSNWTGVGSSFTGVFFRTQSNVDSTGKNIQGIDVRASSNGYNCGVVTGAYFEANEKDGAANQTIEGLRGGEFNISFYDDVAHTTTLSGESMCLFLTIGTGSGMSTYTDINGMIIEARDSVPTNRTLGNAIEIRSKPAEGIHTFTTGLLINTPTTTGISIAEATTTGISITGNATDAIKIGAGTFGTGISLGGTLTTGISIGTCTGASIHFAGGADGSAEGDFWYDATAHVFKYRDNSGVKTITAA